jgi:hypothetical protein
MRNILSVFSFPLELTIVHAVYKSQGITEKVFVSGLHYVVVSRSKALSGLIFKKSFDSARFIKRKGKTEE